MPVKIDQSAFSYLGAVISPPPPPKQPASGFGEEDNGWEPSLLPTQKIAWNSRAKYNLCYGEKGTGKSIGCLHTAVRHCYENNNALAIILVKEKSMATKGGAWDKLIGQILPEWKEGIGLNFTDVKFDPQHNELVWIENQYGSWSMITVISCPHAHQLRERIRGYEPSFVFVDELTSCASHEYLVAVAAQIGRRPGVLGLQQYYAACNPEGPSHWVYQKWWEEAFDEETGRWDPDYAKFHIPIQENKKNLPDGYVEGLEKLYKHDPVEADRMLRGIWVDRPSGDALFRDCFNIAIHVAPLTDSGIPDHRSRLMPDPTHPFIIGMDPGAVYNAYSFIQWLPPGPGLPWTETLGWLVFDEVCVMKRKVLYNDIVPIIMRRIKWWRTQIQARPGQVWVSDSSAFNQWRPGNTQGSNYDSLEIQRIYETRRAFFDLEPMRIKEAPKFSGSREIRVRLLTQLLNEHRILVSSQCVHHRNMLLNLESEKQKDGKAFDPDLAMSPKRSDHIHVFDSLTYPIITSTITPSILTPSEPGGMHIIPIR